MMSTPKLPITASMDTSTKVMGLALRDVNASLAGSLGIAEGTTEYVNLTNNVSETMENFIGEGSAISTRLTEELCKLTEEVKDTIKKLLRPTDDLEVTSGLSPVQKETLGEEEKAVLAETKKIIADMKAESEKLESFASSSLRTPDRPDRSVIMVAQALLIRRHNAKVVCL